MKHIAVVGSVNADLVIRCARMPEPGETIYGDSFRVFPGGKGANQAVGIAKLGQEVAFVGLVGNDSFGSTLRQSLVDAGVGTAALGTTDSASGVASIYTTVEGENCIVIVSGANAEVTPVYVERHLDVVLGASMILTQLEIPMETVEFLSEVAEENGIPLMLDPAPAAPLSPELMQRTTWLTPNLTEARTLTKVHQVHQGVPDFMELLERLLALGPKNVLLKLGPSGLAAATTAGDRLRIAARRVQAVDTTAAGDALNAGFATALAQGIDLKSALHMATAAGAVSVTRAGAQTSLATLQELHDFTEKHGLSEDTQL